MLFVLFFMTDIFPCLLCQSQASFFASSPSRDFFSCPACALIFVPPFQHLNQAQEKARYLEHQNLVSDPAYQAFLTPFMKALKERVSPDALGLDFGCGPTKALQTWLGQEGYQLEAFDPYFFADPKLLKKQYDFVCLTEVLEHMEKPLEALKEIHQLLKAGGLLAVQTHWLPKDEWAGEQKFPQWHYARDPTHVAFYSPTSLKWIADYFAWGLELLEGDLAFFSKQLP
ncbi:MAG: class I SAM-dependent methyltransferase [Deltaproteobacteria bacterium]|nr:class I SAM-dependent methyltransferase [Deltaproteobacteria bacterium]